MKKATLVLVINLMSIPTLAARDDIKGLGGNESLMRKARALDARNRKRVVQKRAVDRYNRLELSVGYGLFSGGDPYVSTSALGVTSDFHITPRWSLGVRYYDHRNELSSEGKRVFDEFDQAQRAGLITGSAPDVDYPDSTTLGVISFYPLYGKMNLFDQGVAQFDFYLLAGAGQMQLSSGSTETYTAGGGLGLWMSQHIASRLEVRYQNYQDEIFSGPRDQDVVVTSFSLGFLL